MNWKAPSGRAVMAAADSPSGMDVAAMNERGRKLAQDYRVCVNCVFYRADQRQCRRHGPVIAAQFVQIGTRAASTPASQWPQVEPWDCCGDFSGRGQGLVMSGDAPPAAGRDA